MSKIIFITGGERSGKSSFAQQMALSLTDRPVYLATARIWDEDFRNRIQRHISDRDERWTTIEEEKEISKHELTGKVVVLDCITLWLTNFFSDNGYNTDQALIEARAEWTKLMQKDCTIIVVTNEIGMGLHAPSESGRKFVDLQGKMNQFIAAIADEAYLMVSGINVKIK